MTDPIKTNLGHLHSHTITYRGWHHANMTHRFPTFSNLTGTDNTTSQNVLSAEMTEMAAHSLNHNIERVIYLDLRSVTDSGEERNPFVAFRWDTLLHEWAIRNIDGQAMHTHTDGHVYRPNYEEETLLMVQRAGDWIRSNLSMFHWLSCHREPSRNGRCDICEQTRNYWKCRFLKHQIRTADELKMW
jgi:hypothetical protein